MTSSADVRRDTARDLRRKRVAGSRRRIPVAPLEIVPEERRTRPGRSGRGALVRRPTQRHTGWSWAATLATTLALLLLVAVVAYGLRPALGEGDRAAAVGSARTTLESLLSYSSDGFDAHVAEVKPLLGAPFREEFEKVAGADIKPLAEKNRATVQAKVYEAGVMDSSGTGGAGTTVRVMAFVNQATTSTVQKTPAIDQNRVIATMTKVGDRWLLSALEAY